MPRSDSDGVIDGVRALLFGLTHFRLPDGLDKRLRSSQLLSMFNRWVNRALLINGVILYYFYCGFAVVFLQELWPGTFSEDQLSWLRLVFTLDDGGWTNLWGAFRGWIQAQFFLQTMLVIHRKLERVVLVDNGY